MDQLTRNQSILAKYIPDPAIPLISEWIYHFDFKLKIKKPRQSKFGDYRPPLPGLNHQITINHDLNRFAFLITLVHEIAHLQTHERHGDHVKSHGEEWKQSFRELMRPFMRLEIFPQDIFDAIIKYMKDPAASSCSDDNLFRALKRYDKPTALVHLETLPNNVEFIFNDRNFIKGPKVRTRYKCIEKDSKNVYLFAALAEVKLVGSLES